jgi:plastocyanin
MDAKSARHRGCVTFSTFLAFAVTCAGAGELSVTVVAPDGSPVGGAVVVAQPTQSDATPARTSQKAIMDQKDLQFVPEVLVIQTGTVVTFPNSDQVRHQVYSFSPAKPFQLSLYAGDSKPSITFDRAGLVTLGCNIHDSMVGYIYVTDSPWFGRTDAKGVLTLHNLPNANYQVHVWHSRLNESALEIQQLISLTAADNASALQVKLTKALRPALHHHGMDSKWADY